MGSCNLLVKAILIVLFCWVGLNSYAQDRMNYNTYSIDRFQYERYAMAHENTEEALSYFKDGAFYFLDLGDTANYLNCMAHLSDIEHRKGRFNEAFDVLWEALPLAEKIENKRPLLEIYQMFGILYQVYGMGEEALYYTKKGLSISKIYAVEDPKYRDRMISCYLDVAIQYVSMKAFENAILYLDSCYLMDKTNERLYFVDAIYAQVYLEMHEYKEAQQYLKGVLPYLEEKGNGFQTSVLYSLGRLKSANQQIDSAIYYFQQSLFAIDSLQSNLKIKPEVLSLLANEYAKNHQNDVAFSYMHKAKLLSDSLFTLQSQQNRELFEVKNSYRENLLQTEKELAMKNEVLKMSHQARFRLKLLFGVLTLMAVFAFFALFLRSKIKRMAYEKELSREKNNAILNAKNKELTANALQIIEKEQFVNEILETVKLQLPETYRSLYQSYKKGNKKIWDDFHLRFTQTNDLFYKHLLDKYPELTPNDLKHCALIKLNFDSKEMAHLLGISVNSVHMARSRIRKKMNLNREDRLNVVLNKVETQNAP